MSANCRVLPDWCGVRWVLTVGTNRLARTGAWLVPTCGSHLGEPGVAAGTYSAAPGRSAAAAAPRTGSRDMEDALIMSRGDYTLNSVILVSS